EPAYGIAPQATVGCAPGRLGFAAPGAGGGEPGLFGSLIGPAPAIDGLAAPETTALPQGGAPAAWMTGSVGFAVALDPVEEPVGGAGAAGVVNGAPEGPLGATGVRP
ncbi:MAG TPA: hypothetical protein VII73_12775, partial [Caulobacteraceae bacterium]